MKYPVSFDLEFKKNPYKGLYIAIEGIDGSGKTTQVEKLSSHFQKSGKSVVKTTEPRSDTVVGGIIRRVLQGELKVPYAALQYLFSADRAIHHEEIIVPALRDGKIVISDRCFWSSVPYGIMDWMMEKKDGTYNYNRGDIILSAQGILSMYHQFLLPDLTFYLNVSVATAVERFEKKAGKKDIYETRGKLKKICRGYEWLVKRFPQEITVVDGGKEVEEVTEEIIKKINKLQITQ